MRGPEIKEGLDPDQRFWIVIFIVMLIASLEACGQTCLKKARTNQILVFALMGAIFYVGVAALLYMSYKYDGLGHINLVWSCLSIIIAIGIGYYIFDEPMNRYTAATVACAFAAIYFAHKADELN